MENERVFPIDLVMGDWSDDGHGSTWLVAIESSLDIDDLEKAYCAGAEKVGFNFMEVCCSGYDDDILLAYDHKKLLDAGFPRDAIEIPDPDSDEIDDIHLSREDYLQIYLFIVSLGNPKFSFKVFNENTRRVNIGGYGLFVD